MTDHTNRILKKIFIEIECYQKAEINEKALMRYLEPQVSAIEEASIRQILDDFILKIEESLYLFNEKDGKVFLLDKIAELKNIFS